MSQRSEPKPRGRRTAEWIIGGIVGILLIAAIWIKTHEVPIRAKMINDVNQQWSLVVVCRTFAADWNGKFPSIDPKLATTGTPPSSATAFNQLIPDYVDSESAFWVKSKNPLRQKKPVENKHLESHEVSYAYVTGQTANASNSNSPLTADGEMISPGVYGKYHPWSKMKQAVVGFCGGHVKAMPLTSSKPGATVMSNDRRILDIFQPITTSPFGLLDTERKNILLP